MMIGHLFRRFRRWLGFGCAAEPWENAARPYCCELSEHHVQPHVAVTKAGPVTWNGDGKWYMPPEKPFVNSPKEGEFELLAWNEREKRYMKVK